MNKRLPVFALALTLIIHINAKGVELFQVDSFSSGTAGWKVGGGGGGAGGGGAGGGGGGPTGGGGAGGGGPSGPKTLDTNSIDGPFLNYTTDNINTGGRFLIINSAQWAGDYLAAGITGITAVARNDGDSDLAMRLLLEGPGGLFFSAEANSLPSHSDWQSLFFPITSSHMTGGDDFAQTLSDVAQIRIFHNPQPSFPGPLANASMSIDNIRAVPEPQAFCLMWLAGAMIMIHARKTRPAASLDGPKLSSHAQR